MPGRTFIVSDIHGDSRHFRMLRDKLQIDFRQDILYVNGDVLDRGKDSLTLFCELWKLSEAFPGHLILLKGNHELFAQYYLQGLLSGSLWERFGGADTLREMQRLPAVEKARLIRILDALPLYQQIQSPFYGEVILTHSGLLHTHLVRTGEGQIDVIRSIEKAAQEDLYNFLISGDIHYMPTKQLDHTMIVGHVPSIFLEEGGYEIVRKTHLICIDSGAGYRDNRGRRSIYNVEEDQAFYA